MCIRDRSWGGATAQAPWCHWHSLSYRRRIRAQDDSAIPAARRTPHPADHPRCKDTARDRADVDASAAHRGPADVDAILTKMNEVLGLALEMEYCPHAAGPPR